MKATALAIGGAVVVADRLTKLLVERSLGVYQSISVCGDTLRLTHVQNRGVVFGLLSDTQHPLNGWPIALLSTLVLAALVAYLWAAPASKRLLQMSLALVAGGAVGNLWDRLLRGVVTDFVDVGFGIIGVNARWPAFNVADAAICVGVALMAIDAWRGERVPEPASS